MDFSNYEELILKVDKQFNKIKENNSENINCKTNCHLCCRPNISINNLEKNFIQKFLKNNPAIIDKLKKLELLNPYKSHRCRFLDQEGKCGIYSARPVSCRSVGAPLWYKDPEKISLDFENDESELNEIELDINNYAQEVCKLNFVDQDLKSLKLDDFINIDTLNSILVVINQLFEKEYKLDNQRFELSLKGLGINQNPLN